MAKTHRYDRVIYQNVDGEFVKINEPLRPDSFNFLFVCDYGDWSPFMGMKEAMERMPGMLKMNKPDFFFALVER